MVRLYGLSAQMDMQMPLMDSREAARQLRNMARPDAANVPIIAVTANIFWEDVSATIMAGMNDHILKPVSAAALQQTLEQPLHPPEWDAPAGLYAGDLPGTWPRLPFWARKREKSHGRIPQRGQPWLFRVQPYLQFQRQRKNRSFVPHMSGGMCAMLSVLNHISVALPIFGVMSFPGVRTYS